MPWQASPTFPYSLLKVPYKTPYNSHVLLQDIKFPVFLQDFGSSATPCLIKYHMFKNSSLLTYISADHMES
jgi:hypothetical protein